MLVGIPIMNGHPVLSFQPPFICKTFFDSANAEGWFGETWQTPLKRGWGDAPSFLTDWLSGRFNWNVRMNGNKDGRKRRDDRLSEGMILSTPTWKRYRAFLKRCWSFLKTQRPFLKTSRSFCSTQRELYIFKCVRRHALVNTYGGISPHVYTHRATRTYAWAYTYICHCVRLRHILSRDWISLSSLLTKAFLCCIFVVRQI